jgi:hypothetical protein
VLTYRRWHGAHSNPVRSVSSGRAYNAMSEGATRKPQRGRRAPALGPRRVTARTHSPPKESKIGALATAWHAGMSGSPAVAKTADCPICAVERETHVPQSAKWASLSLDLRLISAWAVRCPGTAKRGVVCSRNWLSWAVAAARRRTRQSARPREGRAGTPENESGAAPSPTTRPRSPSTA